VYTKEGKKMKPNEDTSISQESHPFDITKLSTDIAKPYDFVETVVSVKEKKKRSPKQQHPLQPVSQVKPIVSAISATSHGTQSLTDSFDIESLRIPVEYNRQCDVKKLLVTVPVKKPNKSIFFRVRDDVEGAFHAFVLEIKEAGETYLLTPQVAAILPEFARPSKLHVAIDRNGNTFIIPVPLPGEDGKRNQWHESLAHGVERSKFKWVRMAANMSAGAYDLYEAQGGIADPVWTEHTIGQLIEIAFKGKVIADENHPVVAALFGRA
jgi:hypothetical protein